MFDNLITIVGSIGGLLGAYALYATATGKNKTDIGAIVNQQINTILEAKDSDINTLKTEMKELKTLVDSLNTKIQTLTNERLEDKETISTLTIDLKQTEHELSVCEMALKAMTADRDKLIIDRDHWKTMFNGTKGTTKESNQFY